MPNMKSMIEKGLHDMKVSRLVDDQPEKTVTDKEYPWGLRITLDRHAIDKLGLNVSKCCVGEEVELNCRAEIISIRQDKNGYHGSDEEVQLQITHLSYEEED